MVRTGIILAVLLAVPLPATAAIYRWTDPSGRVHYSNVAPGKQARNVTVVVEDSGPSASAAADAEREAARKREEDLLERIAELERRLAAQQHAQVQYTPAPVPPPPPDYSDYGYAPAYYYPAIIYSRIRPIHRHARAFLPRRMPVFHAGGMRRR